jgi:hypothetical protein
MWFTGINYYKLAIEKDRDFIFTTITTTWKPGLAKSVYEQVESFKTRRNACLLNSSTFVVFLAPQKCHVRSQGLN